jgi:hypothetical protein
MVIDFNESSLKLLFHSAIFRLIFLDLKCLWVTETIECETTISHKCLPSNNNIE